MPVSCPFGEPSTNGCLLKPADSTPSRVFVLSDVHLQSDPVIFDHLEPFTNSIGGLRHLQIIARHWPIILNGDLKFYKFALKRLNGSQHVVVVCFSALWRHSGQPKDTGLLPQCDPRPSVADESGHPKCVVRIYPIVSLVIMHFEHKRPELEAFALQGNFLVIDFSYTKPQRLCRGDSSLPVVRVELAQQCPKRDCRHSSCNHITDQALVPVEPELDTIEDQHVLLLRNGVEHGGIAKARLERVQASRNQKQEQPDEQDRQRPIYLLHLIPHPTSKNYRWLQWPSATGDCV